MRLVVGAAWLFPWIFLAAAGSRHRARRLTAVCGFPVRPHMLRHAAATSFAGVPLHVVSRRLGYADAQTTMDLGS
jgi:integrase